MANKLELPLSPDNLLVRWANEIRGFYGHSVYLVGSQVRGTEKPRDIDVCCILPDDEFEMRYGDVDQWIEEGESGMWTDIRWNWSDDVIKKWKHGMEYCNRSKQGFKYNIDFKVIPQKHHDECYKGDERLKLDSR